MNGQRSHRKPRFTLLIFLSGVLISLLARGNSAAPGVAAGAAPAAPMGGLLLPSEAELAKLVAQLGDDDYATRERAGERLRRFGIIARPVLAAAAASRDPEIVHRARQLLENISWTEPTDAEAIRELLTPYNQAQPMTRQNLMVRLVRMSDRLGWEAVLPALLRIIRYEDNEPVRADALRLLVAHDQPTLRAELARLLPEPSTSVIDGLLRAILLRDHPDQAVAVLNRIVEQERARLRQGSNTSDGLLVLLLERRWTSRYAMVLLGQSGQVGVADERKTNAAVEADLVELTERVNSGEPGRASLERLLAWQVERADWTGLERSVGRFADRLRACPRALAWLAAGLRTQGKPDLAVERLAQADRLVAAEPEQQLALAEHLLTLGQNDWAESRLRKLAEEPPRNDVYDLKLNARLRLADLYESAKQPANAVKELETVAKLLEERTGDTLGRYYFKTAGSPAALQARLAMVRYREAQSAVPVNPLRVRETLSVLRTIAFHDAQAAIVAVRDLRAAGLGSDAEKLLDDVRTHYRRLHQRDPDPAYLNSLAWVLARTGERLGEALEASETAIRAAPERSAYWDTLAEVHIAGGRRSEAITAALRALELNPFEPTVQARLVSLRTRQR